MSRTTTKRSAESELKRNRSPRTTLPANTDWRDRLKARIESDPELKTSADRLRKIGAAIQSGRRPDNLTEDDRRLLDKVQAAADGVLASKANIKARFKVEPTDPESWAVLAGASGIGLERALRGDWTYREVYGRVIALKKAHDKSWLASAMMAVLECPDLPDTQIAKRSGVHRGTLSRSGAYQKAAMLARGAPRIASKGFLKTDEDGKVCGLDAEARTTNSKLHPDRGQPIPNSTYFVEYCAGCDEKMRVYKDRVGKNPRCEACQDD